MLQADRSESCALIEMAKGKQKSLGIGSKLNQMVGWSPLFRLHTQHEITSVMCAEQWQVNIMK
jgi:hypothetical protein